MTLGLVGRKVGMTRVFDEQGASVPVTVLEMTPNRVTQLKSKDADGYTAVQVTFGQKKANRVNKAEAGHFAKAGVEAGRGLVEFAAIGQKQALAILRARRNPLMRARPHVVQRLRANAVHLLWRKHKLAPAQSHRHLPRVLAAP